MFHEWNWREAEAAYKKSIELNPGYATAHHWYATLLALKAEIRKLKLPSVARWKSIRYRTTSLRIWASFYYFDREYEKAKEYCRQALEIYPDFPFAHNTFRQSYLKTGEYDKAIEETDYRGENK